jgi:hypothetical protein
VVCFSQASVAQTADEIVANYFENIGGKEAWSKLKGIKMSAKVNQGGMEIPLEIFQMADGRQLTKISLQGNVIKQGVYDGTSVWNTNFQTLKAEKVDEEAAVRFKQETADFPDALYNYKAKSYTLELVGKETIEGTETFKLKLTKKPLKFSGEMVDNINFYYMDTENFVPILVESEIKEGPQKGAVAQTKFSEYQEVQGLYFPFSMEQGIKGVGMQALIIDAVEVNPTVADSEFAFPTE